MATTSLPAKDQPSTVPSKDKTVPGDTFPVMTGTDKTTVEPGIPTMQPSSSSISGTWSDSFIATKDKASASTCMSSISSKDQSSSSAPAIDRTPFSTPGKDQTSTSVPPKDQSTGSSNPTKDQTTTSSIPPNDKTSSSSVQAKDQTTGSSITAKDQSTSSSVSVKDQTIAFSIPAKDQSTSSSVAAKDLTSSTSSQVYGFSIPTSGKDEKTNTKSENSISSSEAYKPETVLASSTVPSVVNYSYTLPPSSVPSSGALSKPETAPSVVVSSFTVPSIISSFTLLSSTPDTAASTPISDSSPTKFETSGIATKSEQPPGGKDLTSTANRPYYNATSSVIPIWTPDLLGNAYGGGFIYAPSIYVTLSPNPTATATGVPPGYGFSITPETSQSTDKAISLGSTPVVLSSDKAGSSGSPSTQTIALSGSGSSYTTDQYGIPTSGTLSTIGSTDCCATSTTLSVGQIDNSGFPVSSTSESSPISYTFGIISPTPITTALYGGNTTLPTGHRSNSSVGGYLNPTALPEYRGFAIRHTMSFTAGLSGILVFVFLI